MRIAQRVVALVLSVGGGLLVPAAAASADPYPIISPLLSVSAGTVVVGSDVTVTGTGYGPDENVNVTTVVQTTAIGRLGEAAGVHQAAARRATAVTDGAGSFSITLRLDEVGLVIITGTGLTSGASASATVRVVPEGGVLPVTGDDGRNLWLFLIGAAVVASGVVLVVLTRSRRPSRPRG